MTERPVSRLPRDPEYWARLARRIGEDAAAPLATYAAGDAWYGVLARSAPWLVAAAVAAMLVLWLALPAPGSATNFQWMERALGPDDVAGRLVGSAEPPDIEVLLVQFAPLADDPAEHEVQR